jgi:tocopherol O-methyltransferase
MRTAHVRDFYDASTPIYEIFAYSKKTLSIHYGYWEKDTKTVAQAMHNEDQAIIENGKIQKNSLVLDAGCGVGGSSIYIAQKTGARIVGISLSPSQVKLARKYAKMKKVDNLVKYEVTNYNQTSFPDNTFDVVYGIESICYAFPKIDFLKEAYRILKPGGRLVISDGFRKRDLHTEAEREIVENFIYGFALQEMVSMAEMKEQINHAGFTKIHSQSKLNEVLPSVKYYYYLSKIFLPFARAFKNLHPSMLAMYRNGIACINAYLGIKAGIADYGIMVATKVH